MSYLNDPRENAICEESGVTWESDNRVEPMYHWGALILDLCGMEPEEYMKNPIVEAIKNSGGSGGGSGEGGGSSQEVVDAINSAKDDIVGAINSAKEDVSQNVSSAATNIVDAISEAKENMSESISSAATDIISSVDDAKSELSENISSAATSISESVSSAKDELSQGISSAATDIVDSVNSAKEQLSQSISSANSETITAINSAATVISESVQSSSTKDIQFYYASVNANEPISESDFVESYAVAGSDMNITFKLGNPSDEDWAAFMAGDITETELRRRSANSFYVAVLPEYEGKFILQENGSIDVTNKFTRFDTTTIDGFVIYRSVDTGYFNDDYSEYNHGISGVGYKITFTK